MDLVENPTKPNIVQDITLADVKVLATTMNITNLGDRGRQTYYYTSDVLSNLRPELGIGITLARVLVETDASSKRKKIPQVFLAVQFIFRIKNFDAYRVQTDDGKTLFSAVLGTTLASLSYSTVRGILLERLCSLRVNDIILPIVDPKDLLEPKPRLDKFIQPPPHGPRPQHSEPQD